MFRGAEQKPPGFPFCFRGLCRSDVLNGQPMAFVIASAVRFLPAAYKIIFQKYMHHTTTSVFKVLLFCVLSCFLVPCFWHLFLEVPLSSNCTFLRYSRTCRRWLQLEATCCCPLSRPLQNCRVGVTIMLYVLSDGAKTHRHRTAIWQSTGHSRRARPPQDPPVETKFSDNCGFHRGFHQDCESTG